MDEHVVTIEWNGPGRLPQEVVFKLYFKEGSVHGTELIGEEVLSLNEELRHMGWSEQNGLSEKDKYHRYLDLQLHRYTLASGIMSCIQLFSHPFALEGSESMTTQIYFTGSTGTLETKTLKC